MSLGEPGVSPGMRIRRAIAIPGLTPRARRPNSVRSLSTLRLGWCNSIRSSGATITASSKASPPAPLLLSARRRRGAARSGVALATRGRAWAVGGHRSAVPLGRFGLARSAAGGVHPLRVARRHVHAGRHLRRRHPALGRAGPPGRHRHRTDAGQSVPRNAELGLRRHVLLRGAELLRRAGRPAAAGRCLPYARPGRGPRRGLQPRRSRRKLPRQLRPLLHRPLPHAVGPGDQLRRPPQRRGPPLHHRERPELDQPISTSTRCGWTPSTRSSTSRPAPSSANWPRPFIAARRNSAAASRSSPRATRTTPATRTCPSAAATAWTASGTTTSTTACTCC